MANRIIISLLIMICCLPACSHTGPEIAGSGRTVDVLAPAVAELRVAFPGLFPADILIAETEKVPSRTVFGDPEPPEGFAGPDPSGQLPAGIYFPPDYRWPDDADISLRQWLLHECFHLVNRRTRAFVPFIDRAFPDESDPLVQWIRRDPYHATFAREEAFINLVTMADPARTPAQKAAVRDFYDHIGARQLDLAAIRTRLAVVPHSQD